VHDPLRTDLLAITRIARDLIDLDSDAVIKVLRDDDVPADGRGVHRHPHPRPARRRLRRPSGAAFFDRDGEVTRLEL